MSIDNTKGDQVDQPSFSSQMPSNCSVKEYYQTKKQNKINVMHQEAYGWYEGTIYFKRVITVPETTKCQYFDTRFSALVKTTSAYECYNRIVEYLKSREDIDPRSQFPSPKGGNFIFKFLGSKLPNDLQIKW